MKIAIRYFSKGGNTKKIADAISGAAGVPALTVAEPLTEDVDILFLGAAPYAFDVDDAVKNFIRGINVSVGKTVLFGTSAAVKSIRKYVEKIFAEKGLTLAPEEFFCRGQFMLAHKGKPDALDEKAAADFAKKVVS